MEFIPAIDLLEGRVVRLHQGRYDEVTVFDADPVALVREYAAAGARTLHVVDLEGARDGEPRHLELIGRMVATAGVAVQVGGGVRTAETVAAWRAAGAARVVLGTRAVEDPAFLREACAAWPGGIVVAVDARGDEVVVRGWTAGAGRPVREVAEHSVAAGAAALLYTQVARDGTGAGPDVAGTLAVQAAVAVPVIASGGIGALDHVRTLASAGVRATVCGRALLDRVFTVREALEAARGGR